MVMVRLTLAELAAMVKVALTRVLDTQLGTDELLQALMLRITSRSALLTKRFAVILFTMVFVNRLVTIGPDRQKPGFSTL